MSFPEHQIVVGELPTSIESFLALRDRVASTPFGGAAVFVTSLAIWGQNRALGVQCLTAAVEASHLVDGPEGLQGKQPSAQVLRNLRDRLESKIYSVRSYFEGTSPATGYELPASLVVRIREQPRDIQPEEAKVFVFSTGADTPRPMRLKKSAKGVWKAFEWSSFEVGVRAPAGPAQPDI